MKAFFKAIEDLFVDVLFALFDTLRFMDSWWTANILNWMFMIIGFSAFVYWMLQLKKHSTNNEEDKSISSHSYL